MIEIGEVKKILKKNNPTKKADRISMYADMYVDYQEAAENIKRHGALCAHPKTGAPIENPYLKIRQQMQAKLSKQQLNTAGLWGDE